MLDQQWTTTIVTEFSSKKQMQNALQIPFYPTKTKIPTATSQEIIVEALQDIHTELCNQRPDNSIVTIRPEQTGVLKQIAITYAQLVDPSNRFAILSDDEDDDDNDDEIIERTRPNQLSPVENAPRHVAPQRVNINDINVTPAVNVHQSVSPQREENTEENDIDFPDIEQQHAAAIDNIEPPVRISTTTNPPAPATHGHNTRLSSKQTAINYTVKHTEPTAYYGNAINPDT
jgi:hypothetical protein